ncbi:IclR family transcriptional regulator domain-containing protein [Oceanobacillus salinisoli]|uniref:IclR family transcriptional regulator domain-containing protein n=1 Tax=Oceanobacillus salinisoli TaxID=2678611 RepID=UPI0012E19F9C|nr:IclR family transcriptional regulator C-terminal domain-containing protein [Oceanobacillus salinisoli]
MSTKNSNNSKQSKDYIQSLDRGLQVIQAFSEKNPTLTISQASEITGLNRPTVRRILLTLEMLGFAESKNKVFSLTARTLTLGYAYLSTQDIWSNAQPFMKDFVAQTGESCSITVLDDTDIIYVARVPAKRIMSINLNVGSRLPASSTSMGHVLLANLPKEKLENLIDKMDLKKHTENSITDKEELLSILSVVKEKDWAGIDQQFEEGVRSIAVPIRDAVGKVIAAINCSVHAGRISKEVLEKEFLPILFETSSKISKTVPVTYQSTQF